MIEPTGVAAACASKTVASALGHFLADVTMHVVGAEAHHRLREVAPKFIERLSGARLPAEHEIAKHGRRSLRSALLCFAGALQYDEHPTPSLVEAIRRHLRDGTLFDQPLIAMRHTPTGDWLREFVSSIRSDVKLERLDRGELRSDDLPRLLATSSDAIEAFELNGRVRTWVEREMGAELAGRPAKFDEYLDIGWPLDSHRDSRVTLHQAWSRFFLSAIRSSPEVTNAFVLQALADLSVDRVREGVTGTSLTDWLGTRVDRLMSMLDRIESAIEKISAEQLPTISDQITRADEGIRQVQSAVESLDTRLIRGGPVEFSYELPPMPDNFVGREAEVREIARLFRAREREKGSGVIAVGLEGPGGVGKSALAVAVGHALSDLYPDGQLFFSLRAHSTSPLSGSFARNVWIQLKHPTTKLPENEDALALMFRNALTKGARSARALVVIDDPASIDDVRALYPPPGGAVLVTSRRSLSCYKPVSVGALALPDAKRLLVRLCPRIDKDGLAEAVAELCARQPIALRAAGSFLRRRKSKPIPEFLKELTEDRLKLLATSAQDDVSLNVEVVLGHSLEGLDPRQLEILRALCIMPRDFDRPAALAVGACEATTLDGLVESNLLVYREDEDRFATHDLISEIARRGSTHDLEMAARHRHAAYYLNLVEKVVSMTSDEDRIDDALALFEGERSHIEAAVKFELSLERTGDGRLARIRQLVEAIANVRSQAISEELKRRERLRDVGKQILQIAAIAFPFGYAAVSIAVTSSLDRSTLPIALLMLVTGLALLRQSLSLGLYSRRVLVVGTDREAVLVADNLKLLRHPRVDVVGFYATRGVGSHEVPDDRVIPKSVSLVEVVDHLDVREVIVAIREQRGGVLPLRDLLDCRVRGIPVTDLSGFYEKVRGEVRIDSLKASWLIYGSGFEQGNVRAAVKRVFDLCAALVLAVVTAPITLLTALAIRLESPGPVIYWQERVGVAGRRFAVFKFRSMRTDAEKDGLARWTSAVDTRVTRVGRIIRKTRIDELPQLLNVLRGEMSFVGPRPERSSFVAQLKEQIPFYDLRHAVKPGLTGWAQVRYSYGASIEDAQTKLQFDLYYVKNHSLFLDLLILFETIRVILLREGNH